MERTGLIFVSIFLSCSIMAQNAPGFSEHMITSTGSARSYLLYVPDNAGSGALPLVFSFHGSGGVPQNQVSTSHFDELADQHGFAVVFPAGEFTNSITARSWNANVEAGVDDVQFVRDMIEDVAGRLDIDRSRIYTSGFSGGGRLSSRLACELSDVLAAAAPVAGLQYPDDCTLKRPMPIIAFHARDDQVNTFEVSEGSRPYWRMGVMTALGRWGQANGCGGIIDQESVAQEVMKLTLNGCNDGAEVIAYLTDTGGHSWPGSDTGSANQDIEATALIWDFFQRHSLP